MKKCEAKAEPSGRLAVEAEAAALKETQEIDPGELKGADEQVGSGGFRHDALDIVTCPPPLVATCSPQPPERNPESPKAAPSPTTASQQGDP